MARAPNGRGFGRRTVLQLEDKPKTNSGFGLSGLIASYGDSDEEEETNINMIKVQPEVSLSSRGSSRSATPTPSEPANLPVKENGNKPEIDNKLADFLAEINAMDGGEDSNGIDGTAMAKEQENSEDSTKPPEIVEEKSDSSDEEPEIEDPRINPPQVPTTVWQHCLDDGTQCYYYWNISTNEVTWEIPPEYSQFLLQQKEYDEQLAYYQKQLAEFENQKKLREERILEKKRIKEEQKQNSTNTSNPSSTAKAPELPQQRLVSNSNPGSPRPFSHYEKDNDSGHDRVSQLVGAESGMTKSHSEPELGTRYQDMANRRPMNTISKGYINFVAAKEPLVLQEPAGEPKKVESSSSNSNIYTKEERFVQDIPPDGECSAAVMIGPSLPPEGLPVPSEEALTNRVSGPQPPDHEISQSQSKEPISQPIASEKTNEADGEDSDFDMDDIDRQLELALERKESTEEDRGVKRKLEDPDSTSLKKPKSDPVKEAFKNKEPVVNPPSHTPPNKKLNRTYVKLKAELADLSSVIMDKLEFLEVTRKGLSKLQILFIELETRLKDWRDGALDSEYMLSKLQEADSQLRNYEISAAPPGWSCHWDRSYRRYFYSNAASGETQWDYPDHVVDPPHEPLPPSYPPQGNVRKPPLVPPMHQRRYRDSYEEIETEDMVTSSVGEYRCAPPPKNLDPASSVSTTAFSHDLPDAISLASQPPPPPPPPLMMFPNGIDPNPPPPPPPPIEMAPASMLLQPPPPPPPPPVESGVSPMDDITENIVQMNQESEEHHNPNVVTFVQDSVITAAPVVATTSAPPCEPSTSLTSSVVATATGSETSTPSASPPRSSSSADIPTSSSPVLVPGKDKKKKKEKKPITGNLALKKKDFPSLVQKWQQIQEEVGRDKGIPPNSNDP